MNEGSDQAESRFQVVVNDEEQYSIWPEEKEVPAGWRPVGVAGAREQCLVFITNKWTDIRPRSLREAVAEPDRRDPLSD